MFDEYTLLTDIDTTVTICDGHDLDDIFTRFAYADYDEYTTRELYNSYTDSKGASNG